MKRFFAMFIDLAIVQIFFMVFTSRFTLPQNIFSETLYRGSSILSFLLYSFIFDYFFNGRTIGKMILGIKIVFIKENKKLFYIMHGIFRLLFYILFPITAIYYFFINKGNLPYDFWFGIKTIDNRG